MPTPEPILAAAAPQPVVVQRVGIPEALLAVFSALSLVLAARLILLLSVAGAFVLGVMAMTRGEWPALAILCAWCMLTVLPLVAVEIWGKRGG